MPTDANPMQSASATKDFIIFPTYFFFFFSMYSLANSVRPSWLFNPIRLASSNALSSSHPSRSTRRIIQKAPTRIAAVQWINTGPFLSCSSVSLRKSSASSSSGALGVDGNVEIAHPQLFHFCFLARTLMFGVSAQVDDDLDARILKLG